MAWATRCGVRAVLVFMALLLATPLLVILASWAVPDMELWQHLWSTVFTRYVWNSLLLSCGVGFLALLLGVWTAWFVTMFRFPCSRFLEWALLLPLAMPAYIIAYSYTGMLDVGGPLQRWVQHWGIFPDWPWYLSGIRSLEGAIVLMALALYPYVYLLVRASLLEQSLCVLEVARSLGCSAWRACFRVALPLARPAMIAGVSLVLMETLADYATVEYFGIPVFATGIFRIWFGLGEEMAAAQLSALLLVFVCVLLAVERGSRRKQRYYHTSSRYSALHPQPLRGMRGGIVAILCMTPVIAGFFLPAGYLFSLAISASGSGFPAPTVQSLGNTLLLSVGAALLCLTVAMIFAYAGRACTAWWVMASLRFASMGYALPGIVVAIGVLIPAIWLDEVLARWWLIFREETPGLIFSGTLLTLVFAYVVRYLRVALGAVEAAFERIKPGMEETARCSGVHAAGIIGRVHIPLIQGTLLTAFLLVFVDTLKELPAALILRPFNFNTLAVRTWELANEERLAEAALPALLIVLIGIVPVVWVSRSIARARPGCRMLYCPRSTVP